MSESDPILPDAPDVSDRPCLDEVDVCVFSESLSLGDVTALLRITSAHCALSGVGVLFIEREM